MVFALIAITGVMLSAIQTMVPQWQVLLIAVSVSLVAPITSLITGILAIFAENKLQTIVYEKFIGWVGWIILMGWFVDEPLQWLIGLHISK